MDTYTYIIDNNLYINLTNKCSNRCVFCVRNKDTYGGYPLWLKSEPTFEDVVKSAGDVSSYNEIVFCGYGEPTYRVDTLVELGKHYRALGKLVRINTNGHGNEINGKNIAPLLAGAVDIVSISLNQSDSEKYDAICKPIYKVGAFEMLLNFATACKNQSEFTTQLSIVDVPDVDIPACQKVADTIGVALKVREYIDID